MQIFILIAFALFVFLLRFLSSLIEFFKIVQFSKTIPGPTIPEILEIARKGEILEWVPILREKHGPTFRIWAGHDLLLFISDPDDLRAILSNNTLLQKSKLYKLMEVWLGRGLLTNSGADWHRRRKLLTPAFHFKILSEFKEPMEENCRILVDKLRNKADGRVFDIYPFITLFALDVICETAMGIKKQAQLQSQSEYVRAVEELCRLLDKQQYAPWKRIEFLLNLTREGRQRNALIKIIHDEMDRVIKMRRKMFEKSRDVKTNREAKNSEDLMTMCSKKCRLAFLDLLLISQIEGSGLTDREIREEVDTFMFEGHDTTSSAIGFALYLLSQHAEVQQRAYEEAVALEGHEKESMIYLEAVIKETLRLYPSVPFFSRLTTENLQVGKITVPKGVSIVNIAYMTHRNERNFPDPEKFKPERFFHSGKYMHPYSFVAFSAGPRNCIGQKFAMLELKCSLSYILRNFELLPAENFKPRPRAELVLKSSNGILVRLRERK